MPQLICRYGDDPARPDAGSVQEHKPDGVAIDMAGYPGCILVPYAGRVEDLPKYGPEPELLGDPPTAIDPRTGLVFEDKRRRAEDRRPYAAPDGTLRLQQASASVALSNACKATLLGGFISAALGTVHTYPSSETDQRNLTLKAGAAILGQQTAGWTASLMCQDASGTWARVAHTPAQLHHVLGDFQTFHDVTVAQLDRLKAGVAGAETAGEALAVSWTGR